jgi:hypothetical protein
MKRNFIKVFQALPLLLITIFIAVRKQFNLTNTIANIVLAVLLVFSIAVLLTVWKYKAPDKKRGSLLLLIAGIVISAFIFIWSMLSE